MTFFNHFCLLSIELYQFVFFIFFLWFLSPDFQQLHVCEEDEDEWQKIHSSLDWAEEADVTMENQSECEETFEG